MAADHAPHVLTPLRHKSDREELRPHNGRNSDDNVPRRGSIRVLLSQTSKALGLPFNETDTPDPLPPTRNKAFQFQRQGTNSSLDVPRSPHSIAGSLDDATKGSSLQRCCKKYISRLIAHFILIMVMGAYILMGTLLYVYIIGPEEEQFEKDRLTTPFVIDDVMNYLKVHVLAYSNVTERNVDNFRIFLYYRIQQAGVYENKRDFSAVSGILHSVSVISGIGIGNPPRTQIGKAVTFPYCFFGVPLFLLFLYVIGDDVGKLIAVLYHQAVCCSMCRHRDKTVMARQFAGGAESLNESYRRIQACVPVSLMLVIIAFYVLLAVLIFGLWENWDAVNSIYFCVMTLMTVGLVDEIPGDKPDRYAVGFNPTAALSNTTHIRRSLVIVYIICGWLLISACFHAVASRISLHKKKKHFKLTHQSRNTSLIFRHNAQSNPNF
ncbi:LOW QUALITY PROTEIN: potassium channel subfamily K member 2-like [Paramacrobiotus metropolitanus]|uniref:LOW QUALITY PROTEIN: potassium channel subfamily K member 2-like n=1 Tax=Paramacrobiotus metropolitanus TaxID=2943436 RepID=UPI0024464435|nr:LOW QUALITY PROTEIN: potassium channel subfamily K member 2-like [Paramacrobiotus metropolitanus]